MSKCCNFVNCRLGVNLLQYCIYDWRNIAPPWIPIRAGAERQKERKYKFWHKAVINSFVLNGGVQATVVPVKPDQHMMSAEASGVSHAAALWWE